MSCKNTGQTLPGMTTCEPSERATSNPLTLSAEASPAKTSATLAKELASRVLEAAFGLSTLESFASFDPDSSSWKTLQRCVLEDSELYSETWPHSGMIQFGRAYELPTLERHTEENASSSWLTPRAIYGEHSGMTCTRHLTGQAINSAWPTPTVCGNHNRAGSSPKSGDGLATAVNRPTPTSRDWKDGDCRNANVEQNNLLGRVALEHQPRGSLSPDWVETLMGFPAGWTDGLPDATKPNTRGSRRASRRKRTKDGSG